MMRRVSRAASQCTPLERVTTPTLLLSAEDDLYQTLPVARQMAKRIPDATLIEFKTGGHFLAGHAKEIWPQVAAFLREQSDTVNVADAQSSGKVSPCFSIVCRRSTQEGRFEKET